MNDPEQWHLHNETYLASALDWLRLRLQQHSKAIETPRLAPSQSHPFPGSVSLTAGTPIPDTQEKLLDQAAETMATAALTDPPPALIILSSLLGLSSFEQRVLLLCAAMEFDTQIPDLCARAQDHPHRPYPTFALALSLFEYPTWDVMSAERPLRYWRLIEVTQSGTQPLTTSPLRIDTRVVNYLKGLNDLDERLHSLLVPLPPPRQTVPLPPSQESTVATILSDLQQSPRPASVIQLVGADALSQQRVAQAAAAQLGLYLYRLPAELLPSSIGELETLSRLWQRESLLLPIALYLDAHDSNPTQTDGTMAALHRFFTRYNGLCFLSLRDGQSTLGQNSLVVEVNKPTALEQRSLWTLLIGSHTPNSPARLSEQFDLNAAVIHQITQTALSHSATHPASPDDIHKALWSGCLTHTRPHLDTLAQRLDPRATWEDIVLPEEDIDLLHQIANQVRQRSTVYQDWGFHQRMNRGLGISTLFAGESGTGKTMAAEVIANDLRLSLYRIDLSAVVSKYIGETEKNLRRLFDAAEDGGAILFFDEADALFGKRSEVKDSHDRYANIEINYLLQRIESYRGLAILATNLKNAIDVAFMRRLRFLVNFTLPGPKERQIIWQKAFPPETPIEGLDFKHLSRFSLAGGNIHNIVLNAAFLAAAAHTPVTMPLVLAATRTEFRKLDRPINEADFRWFPPEVFP